MNKDAVIRRVCSAVKHLKEDDVENGFIQVCHAIEPVARSEGLQGGQGKVSKDWLQENQELLVRSTFGGTAVGSKSFRTKLNYEPLQKHQVDGTNRLDEIIYHAIRCALAHEAAIPGNLQFIDQVAINGDGKTLQLPKTLAWALCVLIVTSPTLAGTTEQVPLTFRFGTHVLPCEAMWGNRNEVLWFLRSIRVAVDHPVTELP